MQFFQKFIAVAMLLSCTFANAGKPKEIFSSEI